MPLARHFLGRLQALLSSKTPGYKYLNVRTEVLEDLALWIKLLALLAHIGWSLNCLVTRQPSKVHFSDSCPFGIGGYSTSGRAWLILAPTPSRLFGNRRVNNFLEFLDTGQLRNIDLAAKIVSWVLQALQIAESSLTPNKKQAINQEKESGGVGSGSATKPVFKMTPSSVLYASKSEPSSAKHSLHASDPQPGWSKGGLEAQVRSQYLQGLSKKPQATWPRHFGAITNRAPLHNQNGANFHPLIAEMFSGYTNVDSPPERRRAITPKLLRYLFQLTGAGKVTTMDLGVTYIMAELAVIGFFWAVRSCENVTPPVPGKTRIIRFRNIMFRIALNAILPHTSSLMVLSRAERVSVTFDNQKNGQKLDTRTHQRTGDGVLCPSVRFASIVQRAYRMVPNCSGDTQVNAVYVTDKIHYITQDFLRCQLRQACTVGGAKGTFGFDPHEIGTRSLCSGAAMALFLMDHHPHKTMILGRCSSDAFLVYIRPQVLE